MQTFPLEPDVRDHAFPDDGFLKPYIYRWQIKNEVAQIVKDRPVMIDLHTVHQRRAMQHDDIRAGIDFFVRPFLEPIRWS